MPVYEYKCDGCGTSFTETRRRDKRGAPATCPSCKKVTRKRVFSTGGLSKSRREDRAAPVSETGTGTGTGGAGFHIVGGKNLTFIDCESHSNREAGFVFEGGENNVLYNTKISGSPKGIVARKGARITDHNTQIS